MTCVKVELSRQNRKEGQAIRYEQDNTNNAVSAKGNNLISYFVRFSFHFCFKYKSKLGFYEKVKKNAF